MKKGYIILLPLLVTIPACGPFKKKAADKPVSKNTSTQVDIPVANDDVKSYFDEDLGEFVLEDGVTQGDEYAWIEDEKGTQEFRKVYFEFDKYAINTNQQDAVEYDVNQIKTVLGQAQKENPNAQVTIVVEGHACHSSGSALYNMALSEKRAKALQDELIAAGVPQQSTKIVGRGQEVPAMINGKVVTGDREQQAPNRRDEIRVLIA